MTNAPAISFSDFSVMRIKTLPAKEYVKRKHYSRSCHNLPSPCYGLFVEEGDSKRNMIGVLCFATPCSERVRASVFGEDYKRHVTELHRLFVEDEYEGALTPKGTESWFVSRCLKELKKEKPHIWAVLTFADTTEGHCGTIYKATNAKFCGMTAKSTFYVDQEGCLRHPRQCGVNVSVEEAKERGWKPVKRESKNRYLYLLPDSRKHKKQLQSMCKL